MSKKIIFVHSAGEQGLNQGSSGLVKYIQRKLGSTVYFISPSMTTPENPKYAEWKKDLEQTFASYVEDQEEVILIGHSLGGSVLLKYLSESNINFKVKGLYLIAPPYWGLNNDWQSEEYSLLPFFSKKLNNVARIYLYHSKKDRIVPVEHMTKYSTMLSQIETRLIEGNDHYFHEGLEELVEDLK